ncbi:LysE family translocator [Neorhizobium galegae]|uniref:LysE family translocator n=1 Tax=Neorhizobium galegae TaxID=399 RepID=UPI000621F15C|nr:LysE family translocator [Neorhizobium galegae]KAB1126626.1 LysE family translocator [Neorhizobium galegae]MCQ1808282.1 LysE family translocator [Neorhizobium galegae]CDZ60994.1 RhtB family transporter [Neorhizobium galegae bv. orientalis]
MTYTENLWLFFTLLFGIIVVPGMDMIFVLANSLTRGRTAGLAATAGIIAGGLVHSLYGAVGVGLLANLMPVLFKPLLIAGALYMAWIGVSLIRSSITVDHVGPADTRSNWEAFRRGAVTCLINPKAYLFMLAVYPQFLRPDFGPLAPQATIMAAMTAATQFAIYGGLAAAAGHARQFLVGNGSATIWVGRIAGLLLLAVSMLTLREGLTA